MEDNHMGGGGWGQSRDREMGKGYEALRCIYNSSNDIYFKYCTRSS